MGRTLFEKIWQEHTITDLDDGFALLYIDRIFLHERTGSIALLSLEQAEREVLRPEHVFCVMDHIVDTFPANAQGQRSDHTLMPQGQAFIEATRESAKKANIKLFDINDEYQGISHIVAAEQGLALPGTTLICPDSHTCTLGALGAMAWGIGSSEAEHALATKTLRIKKPKTMRVSFNGTLGAGVTAKDMILHLIGKHSSSGGAGYAIEFAGPAIEALTMEARMTLCNMAVEFSAMTCCIGVDAKTIDYIQDTAYLPPSDSYQWLETKSHCMTFFSDKNAVFDEEIVIDCRQIEPTVTWGTSPEHASGISASVPDPNDNPVTNEQGTIAKALDYMGLQPGDSLQEIKLDAAFIGSCTNSRLSDLRAAAAILKGKKIKDHIAAVCVPGSTQIKKAAEAEGLDKIFVDAGFEWRESGCSMCFYAGGETFGEGKRVISTTNRNFEGRQGPNTRTHLASPATVAASAITGRITDPRTLEKC